MRSWCRGPVLARRGPLRSCGVPLEIRTIAYTLRPDYRDGTPDDGPVVTGYVASNIVRVTLEDLGQIGTVIDTATAAGANRVQALRFTLKDEAAARAEALKQAAVQARAEARTLAAALDLDVVRVLSVSEAGPGVIPASRPATSSP
jgi:uncharacterized protein YggE